MKEETELDCKTENRPLIKKAGLSAQDIVKAMRGTHGRKKAKKSKLQVARPHQSIEILLTRLRHGLVAEECQREQLSLAKQVSLKKL
jgi:hypothetical protein